MLCHQQGSSRLLGQHVLLVCCSACIAQQLLAAVKGVVLCMTNAACNGGLQGGEAAGVFV
jgi:hypothetical protein